MRGVSDGYLCQLWRLAVFAYWNIKPNANMQCHHIQRRGHRTTRWLYFNGIPVCVTPFSDKYHDQCPLCKHRKEFEAKTKESTTCHGFAESSTGREVIKSLIGDETWYKLDILAHKTVRNHCDELGISYDEFKKRKKEELKAIIEGRIKWTIPNSTPCLDC